MPAKTPWAETLNIRYQPEPICIPSTDGTGGELATCKSICGHAETQRKLDETIYEWLKYLGFKTSHIISILANPFFFAKVVTAWVSGWWAFGVFLVTLPFTMIPAGLVKVYMIMKQSLLTGARISAAGARYIQRAMG